MESNVLPWIKDDLAIEIIGKMIAEQVQLLDEYVSAFRNAGVDEDDAIVLESPEYKAYIRRIGEFKLEINQLYDGRDIEKLYKKVNEEYAPYLKEKYTRKASFA